MKKNLFISLAAIAGLLSTLIISDSARAQEPGSVLGVSALFGAQSSSQTDIGTGYYYAVRGTFTSLFAEYRHVDWLGSGNGAAIHENGILAGMDFTLFHVMLSGAVGFGASTSQGPTIPNSISTKLSSYDSFDYDAQAQYQIDIVKGSIELGIGLNYVGESNSVAPITGWGAVASLSFGL